MSAHVQVVISRYVADDEDPADVVRAIRNDLPEFPVATDIGQSVNGVWVDDNGEPL